MNISIIIPSRNRPSFLKDLIYDLNKQTLQFYEIIVVDQSDTPYKFSMNNLVVHIIDSLPGPCIAKNLGLEESRGEILVFLDDDIRIDEDFLENLCNPIIKGQSKVVVGGICDEKGYYPQEKNNPWKKNSSNWLLTLTANPGFPGSCTTISFASGCSAIHRSVYQEIGGFDLFFDPNGAGEDREYGLRIFRAGYSILYQGRAAVRHLGAPSGGRRGSGMGFKYQNILEANSIYIVAKYFNWNIFEDFCASYLQSIRRRGKSVNPRLWLRSVLWCLEAKSYIRRIRAIKQQNGW